MPKKEHKHMTRVSPPSPPAADVSALSETRSSDAAVKADFLSQAPAFVIEEYKRLCAEIDYCLKESTNCVNYSIAATAAFWAWWITAPNWIAKSPVLIIPAVLTVVWALRWRSFQNAMAGIGKYLKMSESLFLQNKHGWETHLSKSGNREVVASKGRWVTGYFTILIAANILIGTVAFIFAPAEDKSHSKAVALAAERLISALTDNADHVNGSSKASAPEPPKVSPVSADERAP